MSGSELLVVPVFTNDFWGEQSFMSNLIIQAPLCKLIYFLIMNVVIYMFKGIQAKNSYISLVNYILSIISVFTCILLYSILDIFSKLPLSNRQRVLIIFNGVIIIAINIVSVWVYSYVLHKSNENARLEFQLQKEQNYSQYYQSLIQQDEQQRLLIHDIKKHLQSILLLNQECANDKVDTYIKQLLSDYEVQDSIQISDNKMLNAICNRYRLLCQKYNISFCTDIRKDCLHWLPENELTTIMCNLLDNAMEASMGLPNAFIEINLYKRQNTTIISIINTCITNPFDIQSGKLISRKVTSKNKSGIFHGIGLKGVSQIVSRHNGIINYDYDEAAKEFHITLSLSESNPS